VRIIFSFLLVLTAFNEHAFAVADEEPTLPSQTIHSQLRIDVFAREPGSFTTRKVGVTPGTVNIPECTDRYFYLDGLNENNIEDYKKELHRLQICRIQLPVRMSDLQFRAYCESGLLSNVLALQIAWSNVSSSSSFVKAPVLRELSISGDTQQSLPSLDNLSSLEILNIGCPNLSSLPSLSKLSNLTELILIPCRKLETLPSLDSLTKLRVFELSNGSGLKSLPSFANLSSLERLVMSGINLSELPSLDKLPNLRYLVLAHISELTSVSVADSTKLATVILTGLPKLNDISKLSILRDLQTLMLRNCPNLSDIRPLAWLPNLIDISITESNKIRNFYPLAAAKKAKKLSISIPDNNLAFLQGMKELETLRLIRCPNLTDVNGLTKVKKLKKVGFEDCENITDADVAYLKKHLPNTIVYK